jgi:glycosyltransferase involved in cell wall biosynthesis
MAICSMWPLNHEYILGMDLPSISCIVPARNESGHLWDLIENIKLLPGISEVVIVEGGSDDDTWTVAQDIEIQFGGFVRAIQQTGRGKFNAVLDGSRICKGTLAIIWDADGTVSLSDTKKILAKSLETQSPAMGNRLLGRIHKDSMQPANWVGNWIFAFLWSPLLWSYPKDMLCGTKIFPINIFKELPLWLSQIDPYGDFALVAFARSKGLKVYSVPVDYFPRTYGSTNINRWSGGIQLLATTLKIYSWAIKGFK